MAAKQKADMKMIKIITCGFVLNPLHSHLSNFKSLLSLLQETKFWLISVGGGVVGGGVVGGGVVSSGKRKRSRPLAGRGGSPFAPNTKQTNTNSNNFSILEDDF